MPFALRWFVALLLILGVACSSDSKDQKASSSTTSTTSTTIKSLSPDEVDASASPYCATWAEIRKVGGPTLTGDPAKDAEARKAHYAKLVPRTEKLVSEAPAEIKKPAQYALAQVQEVARTGSDDAFKKPDAADMQQRLAKYALDNCTKG